MSAPEADTVVVTFVDPSPLPQSAFLQAVFPERSFRDLGAPEPGWRRLAPSTPPGDAIMVSDSALLAPLSSGWRSLAGSLAVNRVLRLQPRVLFFHAATVSLRGGRGALLLGGKGCGKTTLALAMAARGHGFLGDEIGAVDSDRWLLLPVRRAASVRDGPAAAAVASATAAFPAEPFPDGTVRRRVIAGQAFPNAPGRPAPLGALVFLSGFGARAAIRPLAPGPADLRRLTPLPSTLWDDSPPRRAFRLLELLGKARCFDLTVGPADQTADILERLLETTHGAHGT
jgi:hypothetical protein